MPSLTPGGGSTARFGTGHRQWLLHTTPLPGPMRGALLLDSINGASLLTGSIRNEYLNSKAGRLEYADSE